MRNTLLIALTLLACRSAPPPPSRAATPPSVRDAGAARASADPLDLVRARGALVGTPVHLHGDGRAPDVVVAFVGDGEQAWGAWAVETTPAGSRLRAVRGWPAGVRVRFAAVDAQRRFVDVAVETTGALDVPAGLRGVLTLVPESDPETSWVVAESDVDLALAAAAIDDPAQLHGDRDEGPALSVARCDALRATARTPATRAQIASRAGIRRLARYPDGLLVDAGMLTAAELAARVPVLAQRIARTRGVECRDDDVRYVDEGSQLRVRAVVNRVAAPAPRASGAVTPTPIAGDGDRALVERFLRARWPGDPDVRGVAALTAQGGTIAVARVGEAEHVAVIVESSVVRALPLGRAVNIRDDRVRATRFVDADGDGRNDVVVEVVDGNVVTHRGLYLTPAASMAGEMRDDLASALVLHTAASLDAGVAALGAVPWRSVPRAQACALMAATRTLAGVRRVATPDLRVVHFEEPGVPAWRAEYLPLSGFTAAAPPGSAVVRCDHMTCAPDRPVCQGAYDNPGPGGTVYWFAWQGAALRLAGFALYMGS